MGSHALIKVNTKGGTAELTGNLVVTFDVNSYSETITAPHVRRPPVPREALQRLYKAVSNARHSDPDMLQSVVPPGEVHLILDGGRLNNSVFSRLFGMGVNGRRMKKGAPQSPQIKGRTYQRQTTVIFTEQSVRRRKLRMAKSFMGLRCTQRLQAFFNSTQPPPSRTHKFLSEQSNLWGAQFLFEWILPPPALMGIRG